MPCLQWQRGWHDCAHSEFKPSRICSQSRSHALLQPEISSSNSIRQNVCATETILAKCFSDMYMRSTNMHEYSHIYVHKYVYKSMLVCMFNNSLYCIHTLNTLSHKTTNTQIYTQLRTHIYNSYMHAYTHDNTHIKHIGKHTQHLGRYVRLKFTMNVYK